MTTTIKHYILIAAVALVASISLGVLLSGPEETAAPSPLPVDEHALAIGQAAEGSGYLYEVQAPQFTASLSQERAPEPEEVTEVETLPETRIKISREGAEIKTGLVSKNPLITPALAKEEKAVTVSGILPNVDLSYEVVPQGVKEKVTLKDRSAPTEYLFDFEATNLEIRKDVFDGLWYFVSQKTGQPVFYIPAPFAIDAKGAKTNLVELRKVIKDDKEYFKLVLDEVWLLAEDRAFPVVIDPSFEVAEDKQEVTEKRNATSKTYQGETPEQFIWQGSMGPIHYQEEDESWQEIDTTLEHSPDPKFQFAVLDNDVKVYFANSALATPFLKLKNKNSTMEVSLVQNQTFNQVDQPPVVEDNAITYPQVLKDTDFRYIVTLSSFLEEFVVQNPEAAFKVFDVIQKLKVPNAFYRENGDGSIEFLDRDTNQQLWYIPPPKLYEIIQKDLRPEPVSETYGVRYDIKQTGPDTFLIQKVLQEEGRNWLLDPERTYPLVVDTTFNKYVLAFCDTACNQYSATDGQCGNYAAWLWGWPDRNRVWIGYYWTWSGHCAGFRFTNVTVPQYALISSATIGVVSAANTTTAVYLRIYLYDINDSVTFGSGNWPCQGAETSAYTTWSIGTTSWSTGSRYYSPSFKSAAIEVIHRSGWSSGNDLSVLFKNTHNDDYTSRGVAGWSVGHTTDGAYLTIVYTTLPNPGYSAGSGTARFNNVKLNNVKIF